MNDAYLAIINPAAGGGRARERVGAALDRLRIAGLAIDTAETCAAGDATRIAREAYARGCRKFIAAGGDGTAFEIVNGLFPESILGPGDMGGGNEIATLGFLPVGTGNSFLRDFEKEDCGKPTSNSRPPHGSGSNQPRSSKSGLERGLQALEARRTRSCDVLRLTHKGGCLYYTNLLSVGFTADVAALRHRQFSGLGQFGYLLSIFLCLAQLKRRPFPVRVDDNAAFDARPCLFLTFNNSKFTGGKMMIAPDAVTDDGLIEYVRWGPIGRVGLVRNLIRLYDGTHTEHPLAERQAVRRVEFQLDAPIDVMVDGEVMRLECQTIDVLPSALRVVV